MNKYFISFYYTSIDGELFFGDVVIGIEGGIKDCDDILEIKDKLKRDKKCSDVEELVITNIIKLPI